MLLVNEITKSPAFGSCFHLFEAGIEASDGVGCLTMLFRLFRILFRVVINEERKALKPRRLPELSGERGEGTLSLSAFIFNKLGSAVWDGAPNFPPHDLGDFDDIKILFFINTQNFWTYTCIHYVERYFYKRN
jgi:hypothetical protein